MAVWGSWALDGAGHGFVLGVDVQTVSESDTQAVLRGTWYVQVNWGVSDSSNNFQATFGAFGFSGSVPISLSNGQTQTLLTQDITITKIYGSVTNFTIAAGLDGLDAFGTGLHASVSWSGSVAARPYSAPAAVTGLTVARVSDTQHNVSWTNNATTGAPYQAMAVDRWDSQSGSWSRVATIYSAATSWSDTTTQANRKYQYRVRAANSAGDGAWAYSSTVSTTPAAVTALSATRNSSGNVVLSWTPDAQSLNVAANFAIERSTDGGSTWSALTSPAITATSYTHTSPSTATSHRYRIRLVATSGATTYSSWVTSAIIYSLPAAATGVAAARVSDTQHTITWTRNATATGPYDSQVVQRSTNGGSWATVATVSSTATSYSDTTTVANRSYQWRIQAVNSTGSSYSSASSALYTTPAAPTSTTAAKNASGDIVVTIAGIPAYSQFSTEVYESADGGAWTLKTTLTGGSLTYTHTAPSTSVTHQYRARHKTSTGMALYSGYATSAVVVLTTPPNAPSGLGPTTVGDAAESRTLTWVHNSADSSPQRKYQIRHRTDGGAWVEMAAVTSATASATIAGGTWSNPALIEWQVRTWGQATSGGSDGTGASAYSATSSFNLSTRPTVSVNTPADGGTVTSSTVTATWGYFDAEGSAQSTWKADLLDVFGTVVEARSGAGATTSVTFNSVVVNGGLYSVRVQVRDGAGLWSSYDTASITVDYALPPTPTVAATWDATAGRVNLTVSAPAPTGAEVAVDHVDIFRSIDSGPWVKIASGASLDVTVPDYGPTVAGSNRYRADAVSSLPSVAESAVVEIITPAAGDGPGALWLSGGPSMSRACRGVGNIERSAAADLVTRVVRRYAGREKALEVSGEQVARSWQVSLDYVGAMDDVPQSSPAEWLMLAALPGPFLLRAPDGLYVFASVSGARAERGAGGAITGIEFTATETEGPADVAYAAGTKVLSVSDNGNGTTTIVVETGALPAAGGSVMLTV